MEQLKHQLRQLSSDQLTELRTYIGGLLQSKPAGKANGQSLLLAAFAGECRRLGLGGISPPVRQLVGRREASVAAFLAHACPNSPAVVRQAILAAAIRLLYEDLQVNGRIANVRNLAYGLDRLPAVLDRAFPAYAHAGLLGMIVRGKNGKKSY